MVVVPGKPEGGLQRAVDFRPASVRIVVVPSLHNAAAISELANTA